MEEFSQSMLARYASSCSTVVLPRVLSGKCRSQVELQLAAYLEGDDRADREAHGGPDKALYAYAVEDLRWWEERLGRSLPYGQFGENVTTEGIEVNDALVGERCSIVTIRLSPSSCSTTQR
jgi:MOSC domain-containing protein YiiM